MCRSRCPLTAAATGPANRKGDTRLPDLPHSVFRLPSRDGGRRLRTAADAAPDGDTITPGRRSGFDRLRHRLLDPFRRFLAAGGNGKPEAIAEEEILVALEAAFSPQRLRTYRRATADRARALDLCVWNTAMSAAFYGPLQVLEVVLRNAMHERLAGRYGAAWYDNPEAGLDAKSRARFAVARSDVARDGHGPHPHRLVSALSFGFWVSLLGEGGCLDEGGDRRADFETTLWRPALRGAFPHRKVLSRRQAHKPLNDLRKLRNRIAHHEPIFARRLLDDHERILDVTGWISPEARTWIERHSRVPLLLDPSRYKTDVRF